jgi:hypothetical protein
MSDDMTRAEIVQAATEEWLSVLGRLWEAVDKPIDAKRLEVYRRELGSVPMGLLEQATSRCIREHTYSNVPTVGEVWEAVRKELSNPFDLPQAILDWEDARWRRVYWQPAAAEPEPS